MDNLTFTKIWKAEEPYCELRVKGQSKYIKVYQDCYMTYKELNKTSKAIQEYCKTYNRELFFIFGELKGNYPPAFSMRILPAHKTGRLKIELDMEIDDNNERLHRCCFYIETELGLLEQFAKNILRIEHEEEIEISLNPFQIDFGEIRMVYY